ncbi:hypothetical protein GH714_019289 [Hevea brasiliensis]|uniref:SUN domain-containing protein n=1 Tax=Hevea brasiliensis TaxID=3981 RepID=A0A6A6LA84_HEVBR|nr:hypothetical protein GH714_019289 [Hevea brasiliensis]
MKRSRRALLQRRAFQKAISGRTHLCRVSLSLFLALWGLFFLFSLWISHGDGYRGESAVLAAGASTCNEANLEPCNEICSVYSDESLCTERASNDELLGSEGNTKYSSVLEQPEANSVSDVKFENNGPKIGRLSHSVPLGLDEFKSRSFSSKTKLGTAQAGGVIHRVEPGGKEYNYASASKGAKVLAFNKEAKGASHVLDKDEDKYLRNPCSAEEKFVIIELSEETLVDTIKIANFEHYSSNLKDFELLGSLVYPTDSWVRLGNFTAANVKHAQRHFSWEFKYKAEVPKNKVPDPVEEVHHQQVGRMPGDTVLKILMQKVHFLDLSLSVLERYLEEVNYRYGNIFKEYDKDLGEKDMVLEKIIPDIQNLLGSQEVIAKEVDDLLSWKSLVSTQMDNLLGDNLALRSMVEGVRENQISIENKENREVLEILLDELFLALVTVHL